MKEHIKVFTGSNEVQWLYSQDWEYHDYGNCKRYLQIIFPYKREMKKEEKYPLILFIPGSAWHKQEMYNDIPQYATLAKCGYVVAVMQYRESDIAYELSLHPEGSVLLSPILKCNIHCTRA